MIWSKKLKKEDEKITQLLKNSATEFKFDPNPGKYRLLASIDQASQKPARSYHFSPAFRYAAAPAVIVLLLSATFTYASGSRPGDKFFAINKSESNKFNNVL